MVEVVAKIRLTGLDIVPNTHIIGSWLPTEVVCHGDTHMHKHTRTHRYMYEYMGVLPGGGGMSNGPQCCE